jgi:hypothetical protein
VADKLDRWIAGRLRAWANLHDPLPTTPPASISAEDEPMIFKRWRVDISSADLARGSWSLTVTVDGRQPFTIPVGANTFFRTPADLNFKVVQNFTDKFGVVYLPSSPVVTPAHPRTPPPRFCFVGFEDAPDPPTFVVVGLDDPSLASVA